MTYTTHLMADTANGIQKVDPVDFPEASWELSLRDFKDAIRTLDDGGAVFYAATPDQTEELEAEYGVHTI